MGIMKRLKDKVAGIIKKKDTRLLRPTGKKTISIGLRSQKQAKQKEPYLRIAQTNVEQAKYSAGAQRQEQIIPRRTMLEDLPTSYNLDRLVLQVRDPWWCHVYWEVTEQTWQNLKQRYKEQFNQARRVLRVYDVTSVVFDGTNANRFFDLYINDYANNWYIDTAEPGRAWCVDLGIILADGRFVTILRSNTVQTPLAGPSWITDEEWMIPEDMFIKLYGLGVGLGSSPLRAKRPWEEIIKQQISSGAITSMGISSVTSPQRQVRQRGFWLVVNTELIVYGATEPDAKLTVQGRPIKLRPDGTFSLRFALPDGKQVIPVEATSADGEEKRVITPIVVKKTE